MSRRIDPSQVPDHGPAYLPRDTHWVFRRGMYVLAIGFLALCLVAGMVPYPDRILATVTLQTDHPMAHVHAKFGGELEEVRVEVGEIVGKGQVLAVMKGLTPYSAIRELKAMKHFMDTDRGPLDMEAKGSLTALGPDLQLAYQRFIQAKQALDLQVEYAEKELSQDKWRWALVQGQQAMEEQLLAVRQSESEQEWAKKQLDRYRILYEKGVIAKQDLETMEKNFDQKEQEWKRSQWAVSKQQSELERMKVERSLRSNAIDLEQRTIETEWTMARQELAAHIKDWEEKHLLISPIPGRVSYSGVWGAYQNLTAGERVFSVEPLETPIWFVQCHIPLHNAGRLKKGQTLLIDLEHWPKRDFGALQGELVSISGVPFEGHYTAVAKLRSNVTTYGKPIQLAPELSGTAEIIIENRSILGGLFQSLYRTVAPAQIPSHDD